MTRIVPSRLLGDQAVLEVSRILNAAGATSEAIRNDVGEDLVVQSQIEGQADSFHVLFQVKGTEKSFNKNGTLSYPFDTEHLYRWCMHDSSVVVCVFHAPSKQMYYFLPRYLFSAWELAVSKKKTLSVVFGLKDSFNEESAKRTIWSCRIRYYQKMLSWRETVIRNSDGVADDATMKRFQTETNLLIFNFLKDVGLVLDKALEPKFVASVKNCAKNFARNNDGSDDPLGVESVFHLCILGHLDTIVQVGLDQTVLDASSWLASQIFQQWHPADWQEITTILKYNSAS